MDGCKEHLVSPVSILHQIGVVKDRITHLVQVFESVLHVYSCSLVQVAVELNVVCLGRPVLLLRRLQVLCYLPCPLLWCLSNHLFLHTCSCLLDGELGLPRIGLLDYHCHWLTCLPCCPVSVSTKDLIHVLALRPIADR